MDYTSDILSAIAESYDYSYQITCKSIQENMSATSIIKSVIDLITKCIKKITEIYNNFFQNLYKFYGMSIVPYYKRNAKLLNVNFYSRFKVKYPENGGNLSTVRIKAGELYYKIIPAIEKIKAANLKVTQDGIIKDIVGDIQGKYDTVSSKVHQYIFGEFKDTRIDNSMWNDFINYRSIYIADRVIKETKQFTDNALKVMNETKGEITPNEMAAGVAACYILTKAICDAFGYSILLSHTVLKIAIAKSVGQ